MQAAHTMTARLHSFRVITAFLLAGVLADSLTTQLGVLTNSHYEQNPAGSALLAHLQWEGVAVVMLCLLWCFYRAGMTVVATRARWGRILTIVVALVALARWIAVIGAILGLSGA